MTMPPDLRRVMALGFLAIAAGLVGCSSLGQKIEPKLSAEVAPGDALPRQAASKYFVEIRPASGKPEAIERELAGPLHVQEALEQSGAAKKFKRMQIELVRPLPSGGWHKMQLEYDTRARRVAPEYDYAILAGDRVIVTEDTTNALDDIMAATLAPLGLKAPPKKAKVASRYQIRG